MPSAAPVAPTFSTRAASASAESFVSRRAEAAGRQRGPPEPPAPGRPALSPPGGRRLGRELRITQGGGGEPVEGPAGERLVVEELPGGVASEAVRTQLPERTATRRPLTP